ncbi:MAG: Type 1 glutamine amidotransferase-like domain-containing protein [Candidatus Kerfeldbacteria bacterium]|nr:Type 1 glutamine amidotransferase-like domain-containing protein [Candidatus Kerfeldbacteria bacterium]
MKVILFGGAELGQAALELKLIQRVIRRLGVKQILHIPFARIHATEAEWSGDWYHRYVHLPEVEYLNAKNKVDIAKARSPLIFISGGSKHVNLIKKIKANPRLLRLIKNAANIIGESAGAMVLGTYFRSGRRDGPRRLLKGLGILKHTIIEPHYTQRNSQAVLVQEMKQARARYGLGIDSLTAIEFELDKFPEKYKKIGHGSIEIKIV